MTGRRARVYFFGKFTGVLEETANGYSFAYADEYLAAKDAEPIALSLPLTKEPYASKQLFPFFKGLIPEGWLLEINSRILHIDPEDDFSLLLATCGDCIGAVSVQPEEVDG